MCKVHRPVSTKVQWLKKEASAPGEPGQNQGGQPRLRPLTVRSYGSVTLDCVSLLMLKINSEELSYVQALQNNASKVNTLDLSNITLEDAGEYICMAENAHGGRAVQAMQSAWLEVLPGETHFVIIPAGFIHSFLWHHINQSVSTGTIISRTESLTPAEMPQGTDPPLSHCY